MVFIPAAKKSGDYMEQMVDFPTRGNHTLDLIVTTLPGQIREVYSPDQLSDHEIVSCHLIIRTKQFSISIKAWPPL
jgi:hypothetical protein